MKRLLVNPNRYRHPLVPLVGPEYVAGDLATAGEIAGFQTHKGCSSSCIYCPESDTRVSFRKIPEVISELRGATAQCLSRFHLCDSEFNEDLDYSMDFLKALKETGLGIDWTLYLKPTNHNRKMFQLMRETGVSLVTLTVDSWKKCPLYWGDIEKIIFSARSNGIKIFIDFLTGFPYEQEDTVKFYLDLFRRLQPDSVGINTYLRLYRGLKVTEIIRNDKALTCHVIGGSEDDSMLRPVFYNSLPDEMIKELIKDDPLFRIEGSVKGVNYSR
ncbi:MAG: radical SAM protein [Thermodesulfovibrionales bacterium]